MTWTMLTIVINLAGGQPVTIPGYTYKSEEDCRARLYEPVVGWIKRDDITTPAALTYAVCVPMDFDMQTPEGE